jgi:hypothetical protein
MRIRQLQVCSGMNISNESSRIAHGGKAVYGARLGILMLEARFPRIPGDMGNAGTWPFPVLYHVVKDASPERVVTQKAAGLLQSFLDGARQLVDAGADGITTNCGFLSIYQREIAEHVQVPVATSSLMQAPFIQSILPHGQTVGILTISARTLTAEHLSAAGINGSVPIAGTEDGNEFTNAIIGNKLTLDAAAAERDIIEAGHKLVERHPKTGAVLLECTNMAPYARALSEAVRLPVFDIYSFINWFHSGLSPRDFGHPSSAGRQWRER